MAGDLKRRYPAHPDEMAVILRGMMAAELRRRTQPESGLTVPGCRHPAPAYNRDTFTLSRLQPGHLHIAPTGGLGSGGSMGHRGGGDT